MQKKQVHQQSGYTRFLDARGNVLGWEGHGPIPSGEEGWADAGDFDPYGHLAAVRTAAERVKNANNPAAKNLYDKLIERGYSPQQASDSTGYVPQGG